MFSRERAEAARDHARNGLHSLAQHRATCRVCSVEPIPCQLGSIIERGAAKFAQQASHALSLYLPTGTMVIYTGPRKQYQGREWRVHGLSVRHPWAGYRLGDFDMDPFEASLDSLQLTGREERERAMYATTRDIVKVLAAALGQYNVPLAVSVERWPGGVRIGWSPIDLNAAEASALKHPDVAARQYISAALYLLSVLRDTCRTGQADALPKIADRARKLAARAGVRV